MREPSSPDMKRQTQPSPEDVTLHAISAKVTLQGQQLVHVIQTQERVIQNQSVTDDNVRTLHTAMKEGFEEVFKRIDGQKANTNREAALTRANTRIWTTAGAAGAYLVMRAMWDRIVAAWHGFFGLGVLQGGYVAVSSPVPG